MSALVTLTLFGALAGCADTGGETEYAAPKDLCGISVQQDALVQLLPSGDEIEVQEKNPVPSRKRCQVNVDGRAALMASQEWWEEGDSIVDVARGIPQLKSAELRDDERYLQTGTGAVKRAECVSTEHPGHHLFVSVQVYGDGVDDAAAVKKAITSYAQAVEKSAACQ
ncbi:hypothetical protein [Streptomyces sp. CL12-4]|uniref:hypothetical protein n=1 Tax=Streptomyces sp. CL12-4 TaxID=2810306 RepID=UPI001EFA58A9|nr:hypothetical protein [Streptomyces sp. CL12-4]MCG8964746.1 hypothetical protein [Streptomyces sp. CL12-4]